MLIAQGGHVFTGMTEGGLVSFPLRVTIWGDVRINLFVHKKVDSYRSTFRRFKSGQEKKSIYTKSLFFCVFNTAFYAGKEEVTEPPHLLFIPSRLCNAAERRYPKVFGELSLPTSA